MIKRRFVKEIYVDEVICDNCGFPMEKGLPLIKDGAKRAISFNCTNPNCANILSCAINHFPGNLIYVYDDNREMIFSNDQTDYNLVSEIETAANDDKGESKTDTNV